MIQKTGKINLPEGKKMALTLTFDFDAASVWMESFGKSSPVYVSRGEYGAVVGVPRVFDVLDKYNLKNMPNALLNVAMHPQVSGRPHMITMLEEFINHALKNDAWITTFEEILGRVEF